MTGKSLSQERVDAFAPGRSDTTEGPKFALEAPSVSLPKGGGAVRAIDEQFRVNPANGTASLTLPLPSTPGRGGTTPPLALRYDVGNGQGVAGLGWSLDTGMIRRRSDDRIPTFDDRDRFSLAGADDLVRALDFDGADWVPTPVGGPYDAVAYRPRTDTDHSRIERFTDGDESWWRVTTKDNVTTIFGRSVASRIADPGDQALVLAWLPSFAYDDRGNAIVFEYVAENLDGVAVSAHESARQRGLATFTNRYLKRVRYANAVPYEPAPDPFGPAAPAGDFYFEIVFDYGDHTGQAPAADADVDWPARTDPSSNRRGGFDVRTYRLLRRALMFHRLPDLNGGAPTLVRSLDLEHVEIDGVTHLAAATQRGYSTRPDGTVSTDALPPVEFDYQPMAWDTTMRSLDSASLTGLPAGASGPMRWMDLDGEGIDGVFAEQAAAWTYKRNLGADPVGGGVRLAPPRPVVPSPSLTGFATGAIALEDLGADGGRQIVVRNGVPRGFYERDRDGWRPFEEFESTVRIDLEPRHLRILDVVGDGRGHLVVSEHDALVWYRSTGRGGHEMGGRVPLEGDPERGPVAVFAGDGYGIHLADMTGDGMADIVRVRDGEVCYWPNLGYGRFGAQIQMSDAPLLGDGDATRVRFADFDGTGTADLVHLGADGCSVYINSAGNRFSSRHDLAVPFTPGAGVELATADVLGQGTPCLVWSSSRAADADAPMRYSDLTGGAKPHLMTEWTTNMGKRVELTHSSSTWHYHQAARDGRPWRTRLAFPVHCLRRVVTHDEVRGVHTTAEYRYFHGYFDAHEREFRGFGMVEQVDTNLIEHYGRDAGGDLSDRALHPPPAMTRTWFVTGDDASSETAEYWPAVSTRAGFAAADELLPEPTSFAATVGAVGALDLAGSAHGVRRAERGVARRVERFGLDAPAVGASDEQRRRELTPYMAETTGSEVRMVQPAVAGQPAVYTVHERERVTRHYERVAADLRTEQRLNADVDELGNVRLAVDVRHGRAIADPSLSLAAAALQTRTHVTVDVATFTGDVIDDRNHLVRRAASTTTFEIRGLAFGGALATVGDLRRAGFDVIADSVVTDDPDALPPPGTVTRRRISATEHTFWNATFDAQLVVGTVTAPALAHGSYQLALTPAIIAEAYEGRLDPADLPASGYVELEPGTWWVPSGHHRYRAGTDTVADARARFLQPVGHVDAVEVTTEIGNHAPTALLVTSTTDAVGNTTAITGIDWRSLSPIAVTDPNGNASFNVHDELGRVKATAMAGKGEGDSIAGHTSWTTVAEQAGLAAFAAAPSADELAAAAIALLGAASARYVYDAHGFVRAGGPGASAVASISRELHAAVAPVSPVQVAFEYSNGKGEVELRKAQAEPGVTKRATLHPDGSVTVEEIDTAAMVPPRLRWVGNGRKVVDDKDNTVKEYEPFFSATHAFETAAELVESGVAALRTNDPLGRPMRVDHPDGTFVRTELAAWHTTEHDRNDTATESVWYDRRANRLIDAALLAAGKDPAREQQAAQSTEAHADTPFVRHLDSCGRPAVEMYDAGDDGAGNHQLFVTEYHRDVTGRARSVVDARGVTTMAYVYDLRGTLVRYDSADSGTRRMFVDARGEPRHAWDARGHRLSVDYADAMRRPTLRRVTGGDGAAPLDNVVERIVYGEGEPNATARNLRTRMAVVYDTAGTVSNDTYDLAGNLSASRRRFTTDYRNVVDWSGPLAGLDAALEPEEHASSAVYDALGRVAERVAADGTVYRPAYNAANLLESVTVTQDGASTVHITGIDYDEHGRRRTITFGNGVTTSYEYDAETFRLVSLVARDAGATALCDMSYTYDANGNVTHVADACVPTVFYDNHIVDALSTYRYDSLYRVVEATGREHTAQVDFRVADNWTDATMRVSLNPNDSLAWRTYTQRYEYDEASNLATMTHVAPGGGWVRSYDYAPGSNHLVATHVGADDYAYATDAHGCLAAMPHLTVTEWNFRDELAATATQAVAAGTPPITWYCYDGKGNRVRKVTDSAAAAGGQPVKRSERLYLDGAEIAREFDGAGAQTRLDRTFHVTDGHARVALIERRRQGGVDTARVRYQGVDHLSSPRIETDAAGAVIAYELFHPFGTTAYEATATQLGPAARRYRYTGMERDAESGLAVHGARYYAPWLGRWTAPDRHPDRLDGNRYAYVKNNPLAYRDPNGLFEEPVHGALTYRLAVAAGFSPSDAAEIAIATAGMDHDTRYFPGDTIGEMQLQILKGTTQEHHYPTQERALARVNEDLALGVPDLREFGRHLHSLQDVGFTDAPGPHNRSSVRLLGPTVGLVGAAAAGLGVAAAAGASAAFDAGGGWNALGLLAVIVAVAAFAFALYGLVFALVGSGTGHPSYLTEGKTIDGKDKERLFSAFWSHAADRAFEDPKANTRELLRIYDVLKQAARATNPNAVADDNAAAQAIRDIVRADTSQAINNYFNAPAVNNRVGITGPSYAEIRAGAPWSQRPPDVSLSNGTFMYQPTLIQTP